MPENDQTRWIGIRPVNPAENIPVDITACAGCVKIEPCAAGTEFKTLTQKRAPAIGDLQAVKDVILIKDEFTVLVIGNQYRSLYTVPADTLGMSSTFSVYASTNNPTNIMPYINRGGTLYMLGNEPYPVAAASIVWPLNIPAKAGDKYEVLWKGCLVGDVLTSFLIAYIVPAYT